jgi:hypothetical protein
VRRLPRAQLQLQLRRAQLAVALGQRLAQRRELRRLRRERAAALLKVGGSARRGSI